MMHMLLLMIATHTFRRVMDQELTLLEPHKDFFVDENQLSTSLLKQLIHEAFQLKCRYPQHESFTQL